MMENNELQKPDFSQFWGGTGSYYKHWLNGYYTDGVKWVAETYKCWWLVDLVFSHKPLLSKYADQMPLYCWIEPFTTEEILQGAKVKTRFYDDEFNEKTGTIQTIEFTDFPFDLFDGKFGFLVGGDGDGRLIMSLREED